MAKKESFDTELFSDAKEAAEMNSIWDEGKAQAAQPIGTFQVDIVDAAQERSQSSDRLQIRYELVVIAGEHKGHVFRKFDGLATPQQSQIAQNQLKSLGVDISKMTLGKLPAVLLSLVGTKAQVSTKQNGPYFNIYFQKPLKGMPKTKKTTKKKTTTARGGGGGGRRGRAF